MAQLLCTICQNEYGVVIFTALEDGDTQTVGAECLPGFALGLTASVTTGMPPELAESYGEHFDAIAANDSRIRSRSANGTANTSGKTKRARSEANSASAEVSEPLTHSDLTTPDNAAG